MKKISTILLSVFCFFETNACDICGCGVGGNYIGILPEFNKHAVGLRYRVNSLRTHIGAGGATTYLTTSERYQTVELWGAWNIREKLRIMTSVPYAFNERTNQGVSKNKNGIGDVSATVYYQLFNKMRMIQENKNLTQILWLGGGVKLPTGKYANADKQSTSQNTNLFQLGTGSVDFTLNAMYDLVVENTGINISSSYKANMNNKYDYNYGNKLNTSAQLYHKFSIKDKITVAPNAGIMYESSKRDIDNNILVDISGGRLLRGTLGIEAVYKKMSIGANWQTPLSQNLADGFVKANNKGMVHISFIL